MFCQNCGTKVPEEANVCINCGCPAGSAPAPAKKVKKSAPKKVILLSCIGAVVLVLAILALAIFLPKEVTLDALDAPPAKIAVLFKLGVPQESRGNIWVYKNVNFCGIEVDRLWVNHKEGQYVLWENNESDQEELAALMRNGCSLDRVIGSGTYYDYNYGNLKITTDRNCSYISMQYKK